VTAVAVIVSLPPQGQVKQLNTIETLLQKLQIKIRKLQERKKDTQWKTLWVMI